MEQSRNGSSAPDAEGAADARAAGLRYVSDDLPGIRRVRQGKGFSYRDPGGRRLNGRDRRRVQRLAVPPAWTDVWISPDPQAHLRATGRDSRGRKQYIYHPLWRELRDATKYHRMTAFGRALPRLRARVRRDLRRRGLPREKVVAAVMRLLETGLMRIGNRRYARANRSFGLTTLRNRHVDVNESHVRFEFRAKGGLRQTVDLYDRRLARIVASCQELPGQELFSYVNSDGIVRSVDSADVNLYLQEATGEQFTAKDFRTWAGTVLAAAALRDSHAAGTSAPTQRALAQAVEQVAKQLGNTKTICRKCYIHPHVFEGFEDGNLLRALGAAEDGAGRARKGLTAEETAVLRPSEDRGCRGCKDHRKPRRGAVRWRCLDRARASPPRDAEASP